MGKEWDPEDIFDVLGSELARHILVLASDESRSARQLAERCGASLPTVYRRVDALQEYGLLDEELRIDEQGNKFRLFETRLNRVCFEVDDDGFDVDVEFRRDTVDQFEAFWTDLERSGQGDER